MHIYLCRNDFCAEAPGWPKAVWFVYELPLQDIFICDKYYAIYNSVLLRDLTFGAPRIEILIWRCADCTQMARLAGSPLKPRRAFSISAPTLQTGSIWRGCAIFKFHSTIDATPAYRTARRCRVETIDIFPAAENYFILLNPISDWSDVATCRGGGEGGRGGPPTTRTADQARPFSARRESLGFSALTLRIYIPRFAGTGLALIFSVSVNKGWQFPNCWVQSSFTTE